ncbi:TonB-dependent siderophore receptor [Methylobacterium sp. JK268]
MLAQIGLAGGRVIAFPAELTRGRVAGPIAGRMSVEEAVARALAGTGLAAVPGAHGALTIRRAQAAGQARDADALPQPDEIALAVIDVADLVGGTGDRGFAAGTTSTSDRLNIPLKEDPRSVVGVTREVIQAQAQTSILDAARNASNVTVNNGAAQGQGIPSYTIRGFNVQNVMVGGRLAPRGVNIPIQDVERVDVIKGPTSDLTGVSFAGGGINVIPKVPGPDPIRQAEVLLGSRFYRTLAFDLGGPVEGTEGLLYRVNLSGNTADTAPGGDRSPHEGLISPKVRWSDGATTVTAGTRYFDQISGLPPMTIGNSALHFRPVHVSRDAPIGTPDAGASFRVFNPQIDIEHKFGSVDAGDLGSFDFTARNRTGYISSNYTSIGYIAVSASDSPTTVAPAGGILSKTERQIVTQSDLIVSHYLGDYENTMRLGVDYTSDFQSTLSALTYPSLKFDVLAPPSTLPLPSRTGLRRKTYTDDDDLGFAFQDKIDLFDRLHILGTVRQDYYNEVDTYSTSKRITRTDQRALTYSGGAVYDVTKWMSIYGTMATGFLPNQGILGDGQPAPPRFSNLSEYGCKFNLFNDKFRITVARFDNEFSNTIIYNYGPGGNYLGPGDRASGVELDFQGQITDNISVIGGLGRTLYRNTNAKPGDAYPGVPTYTGTLFGVYTFTEGALKGFQVGAGTRAIAGTYTSFGPKAGNSTIPGYVLYDAMLSYTRDAVTVSLNVKNLLDRYYYEPTQVPYFIPVGLGRTVLAQARIAF